MADQRPIPKKKRTHDGKRKVPRDADGEPIKAKLTSPAMGNGRKERDKQNRPPERQGGRPVTSMSPKQIRARARRRGKLLEEDLAALYKPIEEWDAEELARGRPRAKDGSWSGKLPAYIPREVHEKIIARFRDVVKGKMDELTIPALSVLNEMLTNDEIDAKGRYVVPPNTKVDIAKFLLEHVVGKPTQRLEADISVKLQAILGHAIVNPDLSPAVGYAALPAASEDDDDDIIDAEIA